MPLVNGSAQIIDDPYVRIEDGVAVPDDCPAIVTASRLLVDGGALSRRNHRTGVLWPNDRPVADLAPHLGLVSLVALVFPSFKDGRAYSQARILRERYNFAGELRATGQVLRDQFLLLRRSGFDAFEVSKPADAQVFADTIRRYSVFYQPGSPLDAATRIGRS